MRQSMAMLMLTVVLVTAVSFPVSARGHAGGARGHSAFGARAPVAHAAAPHHHAARAAAGVFVGAAVAAPLFISAPRYYYPPPVRHVTPVASPAYWYYCPQLEAYYPYVQECPGLWQLVMPQPPH